MRLADALQRLPVLVAEYVADLETLLASEDVSRGRDPLAALVTEVLLHPVTVNGKRMVEVEVLG